MIVPFLKNVPIAVPILTASSGVKSLLTIPLMPFVPKSFFCLFDISFF